MRRIEENLHWLAAIAAIISAIWLFSSPDYEPAIALISSVILWITTRKKPTEKNFVTGGGFPNDVKSLDLSLKVSPLLEGAYSSDRPKLIEKIVSSVDIVSPQDALDTLEKCYHSDRPKVLKLLAPKIYPRPSQKEVEAILAALYASDQVVGAEVLAKIRSR